VSQAILQPKLFEPEEPQPPRSGRMAREEAVDGQIVDVLSGALIDGNNVRLPKIPIDVYRRVAAILERLGGRWRGGRTQAHVFQSPPGEAIRRVIETGRIRVRNPEEFFGTPDEAAELAMAWADIDSAPRDSWGLEPSAGEGALACRMSEALRGRVDCVEIDDQRAATLRSQGLNVFEGDYLADFDPIRLYSRIVMNPPFSTYSAHVLRAWAMLADPGILVSFVPGGFFYNNVAEVASFRELVDVYGDSIKLPARTFKSSGTDTASGLITLCKGIRAKPQSDAYASHDAHELALYAMNSRENYEARIALFKQVRAGRFVISSDGQTDAATDRMILTYYREVRAGAFKDDVWLRLRRQVEFVGLRDDFITQYLEWSRDEAS